MSVLWHAKSACCPHDCLYFSFRQMKVKQRRTNRSRWNLDHLEKGNDENIHHSRHFLHCTCFMSFIITRVQEFFSFRDINPVCADVQLLFCMLMIAFLPLVIWEWQGENSSPRDTCSCSLEGRTRVFYDLRSSYPAEINEMMQKIQTVTTTHRVIKLSRGKNTAKITRAQGLKKLLSGFAGNYQESRVRNRLRLFSANT